MNNGRIGFRGRLELPAATRGQYLRKEQPTWILIGKSETCTRGSMSRSLKTTANRLQMCPPPALLNPVKASLPPTGSAARNGASVAQEAVRAAGGRAQCSRRGRSHGPVVHLCSVISLKAHGARWLRGSGCRRTARTAPNGDCT